MAVVKIERWSVVVTWLEMNLVANRDVAVKVVVEKDLFAEVELVMAGKG